MLQAPAQKIQLHRLTADLALEFGDAVLVGPAFAVAGECFRAELLQLALPAMQHIRVDLTGTGDFG